MRPLFIILLAFMLGQTGTAQPIAPAPTAPRVWILPPGYECTMRVYAGSGSTPRLAPAKVAAYMIWLQPLQLQYYVSDDLDGVRYWNVMSRETLDAVCQ